MSEYILEMKNISKIYGGNIALDNVSINVKRGVVHALVGENGAGKSTLMKIFLGVEVADSGDIFINGNIIKFTNTREAIEHGVSMIYQELNPISYMTVTENIFLGRELKSGMLGFVDFKTMNSKTTDLFKMLDLNINPNDLMINLSVAKLQLVEIAKAISYNSDIIIMDEPTSALSDFESEKLFKTIELLKQKGVTIIYISHKLDEIYKICDNVTVLRDGKFIGSGNLKDIKRNDLISMMVGRSIVEIFPKTDNQIGDVILEVKNLCIKGLIENISFKLRKGEVLGLAGLMGAGRTEVAEAIFGARKLDSGEILINNKPVKIKNPSVAIKNKLALVPEDRKNFGLVLQLSINDNIIMSRVDKCLKGLLISSKIENQVVKEYIKKLQIKSVNPLLPVSCLSGGNQQKIVIAKCLFSDPNIIILDEPTRGIDIKTKFEIYLLISQMAQQGKAVIMISSEMPEILGMSDRIIVLHEGKISGEIMREEATPESILKMAFKEEGIL